MLRWRAVFFLAFTLPLAYELKKDEVDAALKTATGKAQELYSKLEANVLSKIPKAKTQ